MSQPEMLNVDPPVIRVGDLIAQLEKCDKFAVVRLCVNGNEYSLFVVSETDLNRIARAVLLIGEQDDSDKYYEDLIDEEEGGP